MMEANKFKYPFTTRSSMRRYDITSILYQYVVHERPRAGKGDENECDTTAALYPSEYQKQLLLTTKKRMEMLAILPRPISQLTQSSMPIVSSSPLKVTPNELIFQQFTPGISYNATVTISNTGKMSHFVKLICEPNTSFYVDLKKSLLNIRLAPGMSHVYTIQFHPHEKQDYEHQINIVGDFQTLIIPVIALGPRAILDFPDRIIMPDTGVNIPSSKTILVRNIGDSIAIFSTSSSSSHFSIEPSCGVVKEEQNLQFVINFIAPNVGNYSAIIYLKYETGELLRIDVHGTTFNYDIKLDKKLLTMDDTFIGLSSSKSLKIYNDSEYIVKFMWMKYENAEIDKKQKEKLKKIYKTMEKDTNIHHPDLDYTNLFDSQTYESICKRVHSDDIASLAAENFLYHDSKFVLTPMIGEIWPRSFMNVSVNFQPNTIDEISSEAYLAITGREERLPVRFYGIGLGPSLKLNTTTIDIGNVHLGSIQNFEIVCTNDGLIPGIIVPKEKSSDFGGKIWISPQQLEIQPGGYSSFNLSYSSEKNGEFIETVEFLNRDTSETLLVYIKGHVMCPTLHFDQPQIDFGNSALGFTSKQEVTIHNVSSVPVTFRITVPDDGDEPVITYETFINATNLVASPLFPSNPQEFVISPNKTTLAAHSSLKVEIYFTPNIARTGKTCLKIIIQGADSILVSLPISFKSKVASCTVKPTGSPMRIAFINFPYTLSFMVRNISDVQGFFYVVRESTSIDAVTFYSLSRNQWHLEPGQSRAASVTIITRARGRQEIGMKIRTFGKNTFDTFEAIFNGRGPVISVTPKYLDFGNVELLREQSMSLQLINDSPIPANFKAHIANKDSPWSIPIAYGEINPLKSMELITKLYLRDTGKQSDKILITVAASPTISVTLCANGSGSCIRIHPNIFPNFEMGQLLSYQDNFVQLMLTNESNRWHKLIFSNSTTTRNTRSVPGMPNMKTFKIEPHTVDLPPRSTKEINWLVHSNVCRSISEQWWVYGAAEGQAKRELIGMSNLSATFIEPTVKFNKTELHFHINMGSETENSVSERVIDELEVINVSRMNLKVNLSVRYPFRIITEYEQRVNNASVNLNDNSKSRIRICFSPNIQDTKMYSKKFVEFLRLKYDEHPNVDELKCEGVVNYPNIIPIPRELQFDAFLNDSMEQKLLLNNDGPISVNYKLSWIDESIRVQYFNQTISPAQSFNDSYRSQMDENEEENYIKSIESVNINEFPKEAINLILEVCPMSGIVLPYSTAQISMSFQTQQTICLSAQLLCQVSRGPTEYIKVTARGDNIGYLLDKTHVDFGLQPLFKMCHDIIDVSNICKIKLPYKIDIPLANRSNSKGVLSVRPLVGSIDPETITQLELNYQSMIPGDYEESINMKIGNSELSTITIKGTAVFPQVYLPLPCKLSTKNHPIADEYNAIKLLDIVETIETIGNTTSSINENRNNFEPMIYNGWEIVSISDNALPGIIDIEMIIEKFLAVKHINENKTLTSIHISSKESMPIPLLFSTTYEFNLGYAVIEQYTNRSTVIINHSLCKISIRMKKDKKDNYLTKYGIAIKFRDRENLMPNEFATLDVSIYPLRRDFRERNKVIKRKIYIEVINGCTIPITIVANVTSPWLTTNTNSLNFGHVSIGNCQLSRLFVKNDGLIDCQWKMEFLNTEKSIQMQFYLNNCRGNFAPGESGAIDIHFKPQKSGYVEAQLNIIVHEGLEPKKIFLFGRGIEKKLKIEELSIEFSPTTPYSIAEAREFSIRNVAKCPVEFYWHHLDHKSVEEDRIIRALLHYYQVDEILLPLIDPGSIIPQRLYDFYYSLIDDMMKNQVQQLKNDLITDSSSNLVAGKGNDEKESLEIREKMMNSFSLNSKSTSESSAASNHKLFSSSMSPGSKSLEEIQDLLHLYIDKLHEHSEFIISRKDPLKEIFDELNAEDVKMMDKGNISNERVCIIFHGATFTQYQETACRVGRALDLSVINLDSAFTEIIALGESSNSIKLRQLIDSKYQELIRVVTKSTTDFNFLNSSDERMTKPINAIKIDEIELERFKKNIYFNIPEPDDPAMRLKQFPSIEEIDSMKPLCRYEYKIEGIHLLQNFIDTARATSSNKTNNGKSVIKATNKKSRPKGKKAYEKTFLNLDLYIFEITLQEIFNKEKYQKGFVLQTLDNNFIKTDVSTFRSLLHVIGQMDSMTFVTFHNSLDLYKQKFSEKQNEIRLKQEEDLAVRLKMMDEMSSSDFELLSEDEKCLFFEKVLRPRINEAQQRREKFAEKYKTDNFNFTATSDGENVVLKEDNARQENVKIRYEKQTKIELEKLEKLTEAFIRYRTSLELIESIIQNHFYIWHAKFSDPWDPKIYDLVVHQFTENQLIKQTSIVNETLEPFFKPQLYSVVSKNTERYKYPSHTSGPFSLIALSCNSNTKSSDSSEFKNLIEEIAQPRITLDAGEVKTFKIAFQPTKVGSFADKFQLSIAGVNKKTYEIDVIGRVDIPHLVMDPAVIFNKVEQRKKNELNNPTYFMYNRTFDFGCSLIVDNDKDQKERHTNKSRFSFFNSSMMIVDVEFSLADDNWETFNLQPRTLSIKPNEFDSIEVTAAALESGVNTDRLLVIIKNNPHIEEINLECFGCELDVELSKNNLSFGRVLLLRKECKSVTLKNKSAVPIFWKILSENMDESQISFSTSLNWTPALSDNNIEVCYCGQRVGMMKQSITVGVFADEFNKNPLLSKTLTISGETYDVAVDVIDANPINFNSGKIGEIIKASFTIKNRGHHEINFIIELENMEKINQINRGLAKNLEDDFHIDPSFGSLLPNKTTLINVTFVSKVELNLRQAPLLKCNLLDTNIKPTIVAELPLTVTIRAEYNKFDIEPYPQLFFGPVSIAAHKQMAFYMKNVGIFPVRYKIVPKRINDETSSVQTRPSEKRNEQILPIADIKSRKFSKTPKKQKSVTKSNQVALKFGPFTLKQNQEGSLDINGIKEVIIDCYSETENHFEEEILIFVDNCSIADQNGRILQLSVDYHKPEINFVDFDFIFQDSHVVDSFEDFHCPSEIKPFSIFAKDEMCLHFERVIVSTTHTAKLKLCNTSLVPAEVSMCLQLDALLPNNSPLHTFTLDPPKRYISPLNSETFDIAFTPTLIETYMGLLEVSLNLPSHIGKEKFSIKLSGEGFVAEIVLTQPEIFCKRGHAILEFGKCLVGETDSRDICFKNVGKICTKITTEIIEDLDSLYELNTTNDANHNKVGEHCIEVNSKPGDVTQLSVLFTPKDQGKHEAHVRLLIAENPFESLMINLNGEGFIEPVIISGLPLFNSENIETKNTTDKKSNRNQRYSSRSEVEKKSIQRSRTSSLASTIDSIASSSTISLLYILEMGGCFLNEEKKMSFNIVNKSPDKIFRFEWDYHENFTIEPSLGHIHSLDNKDITVRFLSNEPVSYSKIPLDCVISEIEIIEKSEGIAWDDRHRQVEWIELPVQNDGAEDVDNVGEVFVERVVRAADEPAHETLGPTTLIEVILSASAAYASYSCLIDEINFEDTLIFEEREQKFELKNSGIVNLNYSWNITESSVHHSTSSINNSQHTSHEFSINETYESYIPGRAKCSIDLKNESIENINDKKHETTFEIDSGCGTVLPDESKMFTVHFSPSKAVYYSAELICNINNLNPEVPPLKIFINGSGLLSYYHFEIPNSNYSFDKDLYSVPSDMKIVEFKVIGVGKNYIKHFDLINPTSESYHFSWIDETLRNPDSIPYFHCKMQDGIAESEKRTKITFTFLARDIGVFEALWSFIIREYDLVVPFLLVGIVTAPRVICCTPKIIMPPTSLGARMQRTMIIRNNEDFRLKFKILESSVYSEGKLQSLSVEPMSGILPSRNDHKFLINFKSSLVGDFSFILQCAIERMKEPSKCFITANVSKIRSRVYFSSSSNEKTELHTDKINVINLGKLMLKKLTYANFEVTNMTDIPIQYKWNLNSKSPTIFCNNKYGYKIGMNKISGQIANESKIISIMEVTAMKKLELKNHPITLKIINGPLYKSLINATSVRAPIEFSFSEHDFGACYINKDMKSSPYHVKLQITNNEDTFAIVDCNNVPLPFIVDAEKLTYAIPERGATSISIMFHPLDTNKYQETLNFRINSDVEQKIKLKGEGIAYKVGLVKPRDKFIDFGSVSIGKIVKRKLTIINSAKAPAKLKIGLIKQFIDTLNPPTTPITINDSLHFEPSEHLTLHPNKPQEIVLKFSPTKRMNLFEEKIGGICTDLTIIPLSFIHGRCIAAEFNMNPTHLFFDKVVEGFSVNDKLILHNSGDIGARFKWKIAKLGSYFTIGPLAGYSSPAKDVTFDVCFNPIVPSNEIKGEAIIEIENYQNIKILITGSCSKLPHPKDTILFSVPVRSEQSKNIDAFNDANTNEKIEIIISGSYFHSENILFVEPNSSATCTVTYTPLVMNDKRNPHEGTLIMKFSRRNSIEIYALRGISLPPEAIEKISREIPAKIKYSETFPVYNWLNKSQYFISKIKLMGNYGEPPIYTFEGVDRIEILASGVRDYQAVFCCYKGSLLNFNIIFTNSMGEYQFYELQYKIKEPEIIETIELSATAQESCIYPLKIENPSKNNNITYSTNFQHPDIKIIGLPKILAPGSTETIAIHYSPSIASDSETIFSITATRLGVFPYKLKLTATAPRRIYRILPQMKTALGSSQTFNIVIKNKSEKIDEFTITISNSSFTCEINKIFIPARDEHTIKITHEPYNIGIVQAELILSSTMNSETIYSISGNGITPRPKGPFHLTPDQPLTIPFKNVFPDAKTFVYIVDPTVSFATSSSSNFIDSKQTANIMVRFQDLNGSEDELDTSNSYAVTGKLVVYCTDPELSSINWVYYLQGSFTDKI